METVQVKDKIFRQFISPGQLSQRLDELAHQLNQDYQGKAPILLPILNGAFLFAADLIRRLTVQPELQFVRVSSYGQSMISSGNVEMLVGLEMDIRDRHVIVVEDIVDSGLTYSFLRDYLLAKQPASVEMVSLLFKPDSFKGKYKPAYIGYEIPPAFVIGYGMDYAQLGRELSGVYSLAADLDT